jgi:hypothetical protein
VDGLKGNGDRMEGALVLDDGALFRKVWLKKDER